MLYGLAVFVAALAVRLAYLSGIDSSPYYDVGFQKGADYFTFFVWGLKISSGDLVGEGVFNQAPLYPYFLALIFKLSGGGNLLVPRFVQMLLGSGTAVLAFGLGRKLKGDLAGLLSGLMCAFYGPLIFYDGALLRAGLIAFLYTALVYALMAERPRHPSLRGALVGALFGLCLLGKPNILVMLPVLGWWVWKERTVGGFRGALMLLAGWVIGFTVMMSPLAARNVKAGAPVLALTQRGALEFVSGNHPDVPPWGWQATAEAAEITDQGQNRMVVSFHTLASLYRGRPGDLLLRTARKTGAYLNGYEIPNNLNYYVERRYSGVLSLPWIDWPVLLGLAATGMMLCAGAWRRSLPLYGFVFLYSLGVILFYVIARFRIPVVPALCAFGGAGLVETASNLRRGRWPVFAVLVVAAVVIMVATWPRTPDPLRPNDYRFLAHYHLLKKEPDRAREWFEQGVEKAARNAAERDDALSYYWYAQLLFHAGRPLDRVLEALDASRDRDAASWLTVRIDLLEAECNRRKQQGDIRPAGYRI